MHRKFLFALALALLLASIGSRADGISPGAAMSEQVRPLVLRGDFDALERLHAKYLDPRERSPDGLPQLGRFYLALRFIARDAIAAGAAPAMEQVLTNWRTRDPASPAPVIALADFYLEQAFAYRGFGSADTVSPDRAIATMNYAKLAYDTLLKPGDAVRSDPAWYATMYEVMALYRKDRSLQMKELAPLVDEGMRRFPSYAWIYTAAAYANTEQWGGSWYQVDDIAHAAMRNAAATDGKSMYARVYVDLNQLPEHYGNIFQETMADWKTMREGFQDMVARYPDPDNLNAFAFFACNAGDRQTFEDVLKRIGENLRLADWGAAHDEDQGQVAYRQCVAGVGPLVGNVGERTRIENMPEPRRSLNMMLAGMVRHSGFFGNVVPILAFILGFGLKALGMRRLTAWAIAVAQGPALVLLFPSGRPGMMGWAIAGAIALPALIGGCGVVLAGILVKRRPSAPSAKPPAKPVAAPAVGSNPGESPEELERQFRSSAAGDRDRRLALGRSLAASLVRAGRHPEAAGVFKDCLALEPAFALASAEEVLPIATAARAAGDAKTAIAALRGFDRKYPGHSLLPDIYVFSAKLMADDLGNTEAARKMLKHVAERYPEHPLSSEAKRALEAMG